MDASEQRPLTKKETDEAHSPGARRYGGHTLLTRRQFMRLALATAGVIALGSCDMAEAPTPVPTREATPTPAPLLAEYPAVPAPPSVPPQPGVYRFFTEHEAETVEAITARILPGTPQDPGAREAGVVSYIDLLLSQSDGFVQPVYRGGPYPQLYEGEEPPPEAEDADSTDVVWVAADEIERYGYQSPLTPAEVYRTGLQALDGYTQEQYGADFVALSEDQQDAVVEALVEGEATGFEPFTGTQFFHVLRRHTKEGMFCDPAYGGNRDKVGWRLIGYPGAQRAYTPAELQEEGTAREPWGLQDLPPFHYSRSRGPTPASPAVGTGDADDLNGPDQGGSSHQGH